MMIQFRGYISVPGMLLMEVVLFTCFLSYVKFSLLILTMPVHCLGCRCCQNSMALMPLMWESVLCSLIRLCSLCLYGWHCCCFQSTMLKLIHVFTAVVSPSQSQPPCTQSFSSFPYQFVFIHSSLSAWCSFSVRYFLSVKNVSMIIDSAVLSH